MREQERHLYRCLRLHTTCTVFLCLRFFSSPCASALSQVVYSVTLYTLSAEDTTRRENQTQETAVQCLLCLCTGSAVRGTHLETGCESHEITPLRGEILHSTSHRW